MSNFVRNSFSTNDGVKLSYLEGGNGTPLVLIHGWSQSANTFKDVLDDLSQKFHVYALDLRGHGESEKPDFGYKISRLAKDVHDFITNLNLKDIFLLGHSMGCSVIWSYIELFGEDNIKKLILDDEPPMIIENSIWTEQEKIDSGCILKPEELYPLGNSLVGSDSINASKDFIRSMVSQNMPNETFDWLMTENFKFPRQHAAMLLYNHASNDWRDVIQKINIPTLIIGGKVSNVPWQCLLWINKVIPGSKLEIFEENEGGSHFTFVENPNKFIKIVSDFLAPLENVNLKESIEV